MILGIVAWYFLRHVSIWTCALCADVSLLSLVLLFRSLKEGKTRAYVERIAWHHVRFHALRPKPSEP